MPKMKTNRAAAKRFSKTATGKIKHKRKNLRHKLEGKSKDRKRDLRRAGYLEGGQAEQVERMIPWK
jgi:large subunit ribosomal protein L35